MLQLFIGKPLGAGVRQQDTTRVTLKGLGVRIRRVLKILRKIYRGKHTYSQNYRGHGFSEKKNN